MIVPTLCVGMQPGTLRAPKVDAERPLRHSHAERGNDHYGEAYGFTNRASRLFCARRLA